MYSINKVDTDELYKMVLEANMKIEEGLDEKEFGEQRTLLVVDNSLSFPNLEI